MTKPNPISKEVDSLLNQFSTNEQLSAIKDGFKQTFYNVITTVLLDNMLKSISDPTSRQYVRDALIKAWKETVDIEIAMLRKQFGTDNPLVGSFEATGTTAKNSLEESLTELLNSLGEYDVPTPQGYPDE